MNALSIVISETKKKKQFLHGDLHEMYTICYVSVGSYINDIKISYHTETCRTRDTNLRYAKTRKDNMQMMTTNYNFSH